MLMAFEGGPRIMRLMGRGRVVRVGTSEYQSLISTHYQNQDSQPVVHSTGCRGIIMVEVRKVGTSCGYAVPYFDYKGERPTLLNGFAKRDEATVNEYWRVKNAVSLDGLPGMRHERMGPEWSSHEKNRHWFRRWKGASSSVATTNTIAGRRRGGGAGWWELGSPLANISLVAAGISAGAAIATFALRRQ